MQNPSLSTLRGRPTCPTVMVPSGEKLYALPLHQLEVEIEIHVSTAFIKVTGAWHNIAQYSTDCLLCLPIKGTVTDVKVDLDNRKLATAIVPRNRLEFMGVSTSQDEEDKDAEESEKGKNPQEKEAQEKEVQDEAKEDDEEAPQKGKLPQSAYDQYLPNLFRLPIHDVEPDSMVRATVTYVETLSFRKGMFHLRVPFTIKSKLLAPGKTFDDVMKLRCSINNVTPFDIEHLCSHPLVSVPAKHPRIQFEVSSFILPSVPSAAPVAASPGPSESPADAKHTDFIFSYKISTPEIYANVVNEIVPANLETNQPEGGNLILFITPPSIDQVTQTLPRKIIFLLDRSGSMGGRPFREAMEALTVSLEQLGPQDTFAICAFDDKQTSFNEGRMTHATPKQIKAAGEWIATVPPQGGLTDISTPLLAALDLLEAPEESDSSKQKKETPKPPKGKFVFRSAKNSQAKAKLLPSVAKSSEDDESKFLEPDPDLTLPIVVLLTDGCVQGEVTLCEQVHKRVKQTRILTFGIGSYCNWYFLKMLAQIGRGFSDTCVYYTHIKLQITELFNRVRIPVLTGIEVEIPKPIQQQQHHHQPVAAAAADEEESKELPVVAQEVGVTSFEIYPHPVPDLFMGSPLTISGRYQGKLPEQVIIRGRLVGGGSHTMRVDVRTSDVIPAGRIFLKQRLELLTAKAWMKENLDLREEVIAESCNESMPTPFTAMVAYETTEEKESELAESKKLRTHGKNAWYRDKVTLGKMTAMGGAVVVGAMAFSFGDLASSVGNVPVLGEAHMFVDEIVGCCDDGCIGVCAAMGQCMIC